MRRTPSGERMITRLATGDLEHPEVIDLIDTYREKLPEVADGLTDAEIAMRVLTILLALPRHCPKCDVQHALAS